MAGSLHAAPGSSAESLVLDEFDDVAGAILYQDLLARLRDCHELTDVVGKAVGVIAPEPSGVLQRCNSADERLGRGASRDS